MAVAGARREQHVMGCAARACDGRRAGWGEGAVAPRPRPRVTANKEQSGRAQYGPAAGGRWRAHLEREEGLRVGGGGVEVDQLVPQGYYQWYDGSVQDAVEVADGQLGGDQRGDAAREADDQQGRRVVPLVGHREANEDLFEHHR